MVTVAGRSSVSLWSSKAIMGCAILLSFPVGLILMALNYQAMGSVAGRFAERARFFAIMATVGTIIYIVATNFLTMYGISWVIFLANIGVGFIIRNEMEEELARIQALEGGASVSVASAGTAIGIGLLFSLALIAAFFALGAVGL